MVRIPFSHALSLLLLAGCSADWKTDADLDGDGVTVGDGDCWDSVEGPVAGGPGGKDIFPGATDAPYDGVDADCAGGDDFDVDEDGYRSSEHPQPDGTVGDDCDDANAAVNPSPSVQELWYNDVDENCDGNDDDQDGDGYACTTPADGSGFCTGDCDDTDPSRYPDPSVPEVWYDGFDDNCDGNDGDQDGDGYWLSNYQAVAGVPLPTGAEGGDCLDEGNADALNSFENLAAADIHPGATETWYDGIDQNCADDDDFDADTDGQRSLYLPDELGSVGTDCFDTEEDVSETRFENPAGLDPDQVYTGASDPWYDGTDQDCAGNSDFDQDGDLQDALLYGGTDCNDENVDVYYGRTEDCSTGDDDNCDGTTNELNADGSTPYYLDNDGDGYGLGSPQNWCAGGDAQSHYTAALTGDCDDAAAGVNPGTVEICDSANTDENCNGTADDSDSGATGKSTWYSDADGDAYGDASSSVAACDAPPAYSANGTDCDDDNSAINPAATEICDAGDTDEDCDGTVDDADSSATGQTSFYLDRDADGYGTALSSSSACDAPTGYVALSTDCNDSDAAINPGEAEICDAANTDEDCDNLADDGDTGATGKTSWYPDSDSDAYSNNSASPTSACDAPTGYIARTTSTDCNDAVAAINPGATEICDSSNTDEDCDNTADDADTSATGKTSWYRDADSDTYGLSSSSLSRCDRPSGYVADSTDCNDGAAAINPGATEVCDGANTDEDCDNLVDDSDNSVSSSGKSTYYRDADSDTYGASASSVSRCDLPTGYVVNNTDCNDAAASVNPAAAEVCDSVNADENCNGTADNQDSTTTNFSSFYTDADQDGYGTTPTVQACEVYAGLSTVSGDCNDNSATVLPGATEIARNTVDEDCDGVDDARWTGTRTLSDATSALAGTTGATTAAGTFGGVMAGGYDINGDGYADLLISDRNYDSGNTAATTDVGITYLYQGGVAGIGTLANYRLTDAGGDAWSGQGAGMVGDTNADGKDEVLIGAYRYDDTGHTNAGRVALFRGASSVTGAKTEANATILVTSNTASDYIGWSVAGLGDLVGSDNKPDWAFSSMASASKVYVVSGAKATGASYSPSGAASFTITSTAANQYLGTSIAGDLDATGDGTADLLFSAAGTGKVYLYEGPLTADTTEAGADATLIPSGIAYATWQANTSAYFATNNVSTAGDFNNDGYEDLLVGADGYDGGATDAGAAWLYLGPIGTSPTAAMTFTGSAASDGAGKSVGGGLNVDGDAYDDLLVGVGGAENGATANTGAAILFYGSSSASGTYTLSTVGSSGAVWYGSSAQTYLGLTVLAAGDTNGDNFDDFLLGAPVGKNGSNQAVGLAYYFQGTGQ
jgi:Putative metal-binding motif/FG-GAP repeat